MNRRSIRLFQHKEIEKDILESIVSVAPWVPSRQNKQPLKFLVVDNVSLRESIFKSILWGCKVPAYKVYGKNDNVPAAFILVLVDKKISAAGFEYEVGSAVQNMLIMATACKLGSVWIKSFDKLKIQSLLQLDDSILIDSLIALGYPKQESRVVTMQNEQYTPIINGDLNVIVSKRSVDDVIIWNN